MATSVDFTGYPHKVIIDNKHEITADAVIISTGASAKWLGLADEERLNGRGVSACAVCDGFFFRNQDVVVVGAGDTAAEEASYLAKLCRKVYLLVRRDEMRASKIMQKRLETLPNIEILWNTETVKLNGEEGLESVLVKNNKTGEEQLFWRQPVSLLRLATNQHGYFQRLCSYGRNRIYPNHQRKLLHQHQRRICLR